MIANYSPFLDTSELEPLATSPDPETARCATEELARRNGHRRGFDSGRLFEAPAYETENL